MQAVAHLLHQLVNLLVLLISLVLLRVAPKLVQVQFPVHLLDLGGSGYVGLALVAPEAQISETTGNCVRCLLSMFSHVSVNVSGLHTQVIVIVIVGMIRCDCNCWYVPIVVVGNVVVEIYNFLEQK